MKLQFATLAAGQPSWQAIPANIPAAPWGARRWLAVLALAASLGWWTTPACAALFAADNADNDPYPATNFHIGSNDDNGGDGSLVSAIVPSHDYAWGLGGTCGVGRGLASALPVGTWRVTAVHDPNNSGFSGFNLKTSTQAGFGTGELLRFGLNGSSGTGIYVSTDSGAHYTFLNCGWFNGSGDTLEYNVGWDASGNYSLSVSDLTQTQTEPASFTGTMAHGEVAMLGAVVYGATLSEGLSFDAFEVVAVPEPATVLPLLVVIVLAMGLEHRRRARVSH
ncbi:MAG: PEP-CTERM sorting domain-containing protein [Verrucomicrobia bacterium]|nr:PEP-CTERM sorting domain-containing protein [Verrucomicrobiota bacterium]